jgi:hypothetical protein
MAGAQHRDDMSMFFLLSMTPTAMVVSTGL